MRKLHSFVLPALVTIVAVEALPTLPSVQLSQPMSNAIVALDDGTIVFADGFHRTVWRLAPDGSLSPGEAFANPRTLEVDAGGNVHVHSDPGTVITRTRAGELLVARGSSILRVATDGSTSTIAAGLQLLSPRRTLITRLIGSADGHLTGIAVGAAGEIYVANASRGTIVRLDTDGTAHVVARSEAGWALAGLAAVDGKLFVLENGYGARVRRIDRAGRGRVASWVLPPVSGRIGDGSGRVML